MRSGGKKERKKERWKSSRAVQAEEREVNRESVHESDGERGAVRSDIQSSFTITISIISVSTESSSIVSEI